MNKTTSIPSSRWDDLTIPMEELVSFAIRWTLYLLIGISVPFFAIWGFPSLPDWNAIPVFLWNFFLYLVGFILVYAVSAVLHEVLHAIAMMVFAGIPLRSISFHTRLREGIAYVHTDRPMTVRMYRTVLVLPGLVQGVLPTLLGFVIGNGLLVFYGFVMLSSSVGDLAMLLLMRKLDPDSCVRDHPSRVGCQILRDGPPPT